VIGVEEQAATVVWCPGCLRPDGGAARCPGCGLRQHGADAARLRVVVHRLHELGEAQRTLAAETAALRLEQGRLLRALAPPGPTPQPAVRPGRAAREWRPDLVRGVLLGLGAVLVALAALSFSVVAWVNLGDAGRAGLLVGATVVAVAAAAGARRRLPATAEALGGLALGLALVDWHAARRAGVAAGGSATAWWALGSGAAAVAVGRGLPAPLRLGTALAAGATLAVGVVGLLDPLLRALEAPLAWAGNPWAAAGLRDGAAERLPVPGGRVDGVGAAIVALLAAAGAAALAAAPRPGPRLLAPRLAAVVVAAAGVGIVAALPLAAGWPLWAALLTAGAAAVAAAAGAVLADRGALPAAAPAAVAAGCGAVLVALAACWALATEAGTLAFLGVLAPAAAVAVAAAQSPWLRGGMAAVGAVALLGEAAAAVLHTGGDAAAAGVATAVTGGALLVAGVRWRRGTADGAVLEPIGLGGQVLGVLLAGPDDRWLAVALSAAVPALLLAGVRRPWRTEHQPARGGYLWTGAATALAATWAWLAAAHVSLLEAYTLPAAALALAAGVAARRGRPRPSSWPTLGPGLAVALLPSLEAAVDPGGGARPLLLTVAALLVVLAGAHARLQAPLVLGGGTLLVLGVDAAVPVAAQLPRWVTIGAAGLLLLWLGATSERRLARLRELGQQLREP
jgi:hypothetical protein